MLGAPRQRCGKSFIVHSRHPPAGVSGLFKAGIVLLFCLTLCGCRRRRVDVGAVGPVPAGFPRQLLSFSGPAPAFAPDGKAWDSFGIGAPSNVLLLQGTYWVCTQGYTAAGNISQAIGCWSGPNLTSLKPYPGNPILVNPNLSWTVSCIEGPDFNTDGKNVYMSYVAFSQNCDDEAHGAIGISSTPIAQFPLGFTVPVKPQIPKPDELQWIYRPFITEIDGVCYDYTNAGISVRAHRWRRGMAAQPVVASFKTSGPCATTELDPAAWKFNRLEITDTQSWEGHVEVEEPQVFRVSDGTYVMLYGGAWTFKAGYAYTKDPVNGVWTKLDTNPIKEDGVLWLPRIAQDSTGQYWMLGNFNNTRQMNLWKANGR